MKRSFPSRVRINFLIVVVSLLAAGCMSTSRQTIHQQGQLLPPGSFVFSGIDPGERRAEFAAGLIKALEAHGFGGADRGPYLVQIARSDRPGGVGFLAPAVPPEEAEAMPGPAARPPRRTERVRQLVLSINHASDGQELYRIRGTEVYRPGKADDGGIRLAEMMIAHIAGQ